MSDSPPYPTAVIGLGRIAWKLEEDRLREKPATHVGAILGEPRLRLVAGLDLDPNARTAFEQRYSVPTFERFEDLIDHNRPSLLVIATHPDSHRTYLRKAVSAAIPLVLCEKPLGRVREGFESLLREADRRGTRVMVNHERRYSDDWRQAKRLVDGGELGPPLSFYARIAMGRNRDPGAVLFWDGTHMLDALRFLFPGPWKVQRRWRTRGPDRLGGLIRLGPVSGTLDIVRGFDHLVFELEIQCERGRIRVGNGVWEVSRSEPSPYYEGFRSLRRTAEGPWSVTRYFSGVYADAADCLEDPGRQPVSTGRDGWEALKMIRALEPSLYWAR